MVTQNLSDYASRRQQALAELSAEYQKYNLSYAKKGGHLPLPGCFDLAVDISNLVLTPGRSTPWGDPVAGSISPDEDKEAKARGIAQEIAARYNLEIAIHSGAGARGILLWISYDKHSPLSAKDSVSDDPSAGRLHHVSQSFKISELETVTKEEIASWSRDKDDPTN